MIGRSSGSHCVYCILSASICLCKAPQCNVFRGSFAAVSEHILSVRVSHVGQADVSFIVVLHWAELCLDMCTH